MAKQNTHNQAFNGGEIGKEVMTRTALETYPNSASCMENWLPETSGPMRFRSGLKFVNHIAGDAFGRLRRFQYSVAQSMLFWQTEYATRIVYNGGIVVRPPVTASLPQPAFVSDLTGWTIVIDPYTPGGTGNQGSGNTSGGDFGYGYGGGAGGDGGGSGGSGGGGAGGGGDGPGGGGGGGGGDGPGGGG